MITALLVLGGGGGAYAFLQYIAPATTAGLFCGYLKVQSYPQAYTLFSANLKSQLTQDQFTQSATALDKAEGAITACTAATTGNAYNYSLGSSTAQATMILTRATAGDLQGAIHLKKENGAWTVDGLDTGLLGVNLGALQATVAYCAALQSQNYTAAYALLGSAPRHGLAQADFTQAAQAHDQIDGTVSACGLAALGQPNTDANANLVVSITRGKLGAKQGALGLDVEQGAWKIGSVATALQGTDAGPLLVGTRFCADLVSGNFADAYSLLSPREQSFGTEAQFASDFTLAAPLKWAGCTPDFSTYKVSGSSASYTTGFKVVDSATGASASVNFSMAFVQVGGSWKVNNLTKA